MSWLYDFWFILVALLFLGLSIFVHELGHFLAAKRRGLVIKRFSIGFGPRLFGWERNGVEYRLSAFPFGGYVALPQLVDMGRIEGGETEEDEERKNLPKISFADKMIVSVMGAVFNVLFALSLASVLWFFGHDVDSSWLSTEVGYVAKEMKVFDPKTQKEKSVPGPAFGVILPGDKILEVDGSEVRDFLDLQQHVTAGSGLTPEGRRIARLLVEREGKTIELEVFPEIVSSEQMRMIGIWPKETFFVGTLVKGMPAEKAGLEIDDQPVAIDGHRIHSFAFLIDYLDELEDNASVALTVINNRGNGPEKTYGIVPVPNPNKGMPPSKIIGFMRVNKVVTTYPNPFGMIFNRMEDMYLTLRSLINPKSDVKARNMSGPVGIVKHL
ncbi:MAG: site-2 protease family protein, partial [Opitutales bacterium]